MKSITAADISATTPAQLAALRAGPPEAYAAGSRPPPGLLEAQAILGQMLLDGHGMARDPEAALGWFKRAAQADHPMSINSRCYENGWGVARDETVAAYWFRLAADRGLDWGMYNYAHMLRDGRGGVAQDPAAALALYQRAAQSGHVKSIGVVGRFHEAGTVVPRDLEQAFDCYRRAAEGGDFRGMFHLGRLLLQRGQRDEAEAWLDRVPQTATAVFLREADAMLRKWALRRATASPPSRARSPVPSGDFARHAERFAWPNQGRSRRLLRACLAVGAPACSVQVLSRALRTASSTTRAPGPRSPASRSSSSRPARRPSSAALAVSVLRPGAHWAALPSSDTPSTATSCGTCRSRWWASDTPRQRADPSWRTRRRTGCWWPGAAGRPFGRRSAGRPRAG